MNFKIVVIHVRSADWKHWKLNDFEGGKSWCTECSLSQSAVLQKYFVLGDLWVNGGFFFKIMPLMADLALSIFQKIHLNEPIQRMNREKIKYILYIVGKVISLAVNSCLYFHPGLLVST